MLLWCGPTILDSWECILIMWLPHYRETPESGDMPTLEEFMFMCKPLNENDCLLKDVNPDPLRNANIRWVTASGPHRKVLGIRLVYEPLNISLYSLSQLFMAILCHKVLAGWKRLGSPGSGALFSSAGNASICGMKHTFREKAFHQSYCQTNISWRWVQNYVSEARRIQGTCYCYSPICFIPKKCKISVVKELTASLRSQSLSPAFCRYQKYSRIKWEHLLKHRVFQEVYVLILWEAVTWRKRIESYIVKETGYPAAQSN